MRRVLMLMSLAAVAVCGGDPLGPNGTDSFSRLGGCADVIFYAVDANDGLMLLFRAEGLVSEAQAEGAETVTTFQLPAASAALSLQQGARISDAACDDVIEGAGPKVVRSWTGVSGRATVRMRPLEGQGGARADLILEDVLLEGAGEDDVSIARFEWTDISVGWYPG